jgi:NTE family protein
MGEVKRIASLLPHLNFVNGMDDTPCHSALRYRHFDIYNDLKAQGAQIYMEDKLGFTCPQLMTFLEEHNYMRDSISKSFLTAVAKGETRTVQRYIDFRNQSKISDSHLHTRDEQGDGALHIAVREGHIHLISLLLDQGFAIDEANSKQQTILHGAVAMNKVAVVEMLFSKGAYSLLELGDHRGRTPLHTSIIYGSIDCTALLLAANANSMARDRKGHTIVHLAIQCQQEKSLKFLQESKLIPPDLFDTTDKMGKTPLHLAAFYGSKEAVLWLYHQGAYVEARDEQDKTPLFLAVERKQLAVVKLLVEYCHAEMDVADGQGVSLLAKVKVDRSMQAYFTNSKALRELHPSLTKKKFKIRNLVFQGGSVKGIAYLGSLKKITGDPQYQFKLSEIERIAGTSAGAITAVLLGVGSSLESLEELLNKLDFKELLDGEQRQNFLEIKTALEKDGLTLKNFLTQIIKNPIRFRNIFDKLQIDYGLFAGKYFRDWIEQRITEQTGIPNTTFSELHWLRQEGRKPKKNSEGTFKDVYFIGTNTATGQSEVFSYETTPNMVIADAVRISMSIPLLFIPHQRYFKNEKGEVTVDPGGHLYIDGGVSDNYPIWLFDQSRYLSDVPKDSKNVPIAINRETLGFRLVTWEQKLHYEQQLPQMTKDIAGLMSFVNLELASLELYQHVL